MTPSPTHERLTPARLLEIASRYLSVCCPAPNGCGRCVAEADELRAHAAWLETQEAPADFVDKVKAFNLMLTAVNPTVRRLAERYLEGVKDYDAFVDFLRNHPLEALPKPPEAR